MSPLAGQDRATQPLVTKIDVTEIDKQLWLLRFGDMGIIGAGWVVSVGVFWQILSGKLGNL